MLQFLPPIQNLVDIPPHDALNIGQILIELGGIRSRRGIHEFFPFPLNRNIEFDKGIRSRGGIDDHPPLIPVIPRQLLQKRVGDFFQVEKGQSLRVGLLGEGEVAEGVAEEVVEDEIVGGVNGHTGVVGRLYLVEIAEDVFGLVFVILGY